MCRNCRWLYSVYFIVAVILLCLPGRTATISSEALLLQGKVAVAKQQWSLAIPALEQFCQQAPTSDALPEASVLLFQAYLGQGEMAKATPLWKEILTRWPKTETAWSATEALYRYKAPTDAAGALALLEDLNKQGVLPDGSEKRARDLHLAVMEQINPAEFLAKAPAMTVALSWFPA